MLLAITFKPLNQSSRNWNSRLITIKSRMRKKYDLKWPWPCYKTLQGITFDLIIIIIKTCSRDFLTVNSDATWLAETLTITLKLLIQFALNSCSRLITSKSSLIKIHCPQRFWNSHSAVNTTKYHYFLSFVDVFAKILYSETCAVWNPYIFYIRF